MWTGSLSRLEPALREPIGRVEQPSVAGFGREQDQLTDGDEAAVVIGARP